MTKPANREVYHNSPGNIYTIGHGSLEMVNGSTNQDEMLNEMKIGCRAPRRNVSHMVPECVCHDQEGGFQYGWLYSRIEI